MQIITYQFDQLSNQQLYAILALRAQVFIEEQQSIYTDIDFLDQEALHFCCWQGDTLMGYARLRQLSDKGYFKLERIVTAKQGRGQGLGKALMQAMLTEVDKAGWASLLSAQTRACEFYRAFGYVCIGEAYDDGGILHIDMRRAALPES